MHGDGQGRMHGDAERTVFFVGCLRCCDGRLETAAALGGPVHMGGLRRGDREKQQRKGAHESPYPGGQRRCWPASADALPARGWASGYHSLQCRRRSTGAGRREPFREEWWRLSFEEF